MNFQPIPNWRSLVHDIWFTLKQPKSHLTVYLTGRGYSVTRHADCLGMHIRFDRSLK